MPSEWKSFDVFFGGSVSWLVRWGRGLWFSVDLFCFSFFGGFKERYIYVINEANAAKRINNLCKKYKIMVKHL